MCTAVQAVNVSYGAGALLHAERPSDGSLMGHGSHLLAGAGVLFRLAPRHRMGKQGDVVLTKTPWLPAAGCR